MLSHLQHLSRVGSSAAVACNATANARTLLGSWFGVCRCFQSTPRAQLESLSRGTVTNSLYSYTRSDQQTSCSSFESQQPFLRSHVRNLHSSPIAAAAAESSAAVAEAGPSTLQRVPPPPWTPTRDLVKRKFLPRRMGHLLQVLEQEKRAEADAARPLPDFRPGDVLQLKLTVPENRRRVAIVKGLCIAKRNRGWRTSFTIRNHLGVAGAFERTFPLYSPNIQELVVLESRRVRRSKLYYLRDRAPKEYRV